MCHVDSGNNGRTWATGRSCAQIARNVTCPGALALVAVLRTHAGRANDTSKTTLYRARSELSDRLHRARRLFLGDGRFISAVDQNSGPRKQRSLLWRSRQGRRVAGSMPSKNGVAPLLRRHRKALWTRKQRSNPRSTSFARLRDLFTIWLSSLSEQDFGEIEMTWLGLVCKH